METADAQVFAIATCRIDQLNCACFTVSLVPLWVYLSRFAYQVQWIGRGPSVCVEKAVLMILVAVELAPAFLQQFSNYASIFLKHFLIVHHLGKQLF